MNAPKLCVNETGRCTNIVCRRDFGDSPCRVARSSHSTAMPMARTSPTSGMRAVRHTVPRLRCTSCWTPGRKVSNQEAGDEALERPHSARRRGFHFTFSSDDGQSYDREYQVASPSKEALW